MAESGNKKVISIFMIFVLGIVFFTVIGSSTNTAREPICPVNESYTLNGTTCISQFSNGSESVQQNVASIPVGGGQSILLSLVPILFIIGIVYYGYKQGYWGKQ